MKRLVAHLVSLWGPWWPMPLFLGLLYVGPLLVIGDFRPEHGVFFALVLIFSYLGPRSKAFLVELTPYIVVGVGYDLVRYGRAALVSADRVATCGLQRIDRTLLPAGGGISVQEWLASHHLPALDLFFAVPYAVFAYVALVYAGYLYFKDRPRMRRYLWSFAIANYLSYTLWMLFPAAPPWYVHAYGCSADMNALPSAAGLLRVDEMLGIGYFETFYSRTAFVYGALPSMHNAYPLIGLFTAWNHVGWKTRPLHVLYFLVMAMASLYLDHHWVVDAIAGWATAAVAVALAPYAVQALFGERQLAAVPEVATARMEGPAGGQ